MGSWGRQLGQQARPARWVVPAVVALCTALSITLGACSTRPSPAATRPTPTPTPSGSTQPSGPPSSATASPSLARFTQQKLTWRTCTAPYQCARVTVPVDYAHPDGATISLLIDRLRATDQAHRLGSLLINPGGPGVSGVQFLKDADGMVSTAVKRRYDVVGFDPRGIGGSAAYRCLTDRQTDAFLSVDWSPDTPAEVGALEARTKQLGAGCARAGGALVGHLGTVDVARDLDVIRAALGDARLHYFGKSYGTYIGTIYADEFPRHIGAMVLDGAIDPALTDEQFNLGQTRGFETALTAFVSWCEQQGGCPLHGGRSAGLAQVARLVARFDAHPLVGPDGRTVTQSLAVIGVLQLLYDRANGWPALVEGLASALAGDVSLLETYSDVYDDRGIDGHYQSNSNETLYGVSCLDRPVEGAAAIAAAVPAFVAISPAFGSYLAWGSLPCVYWPAKPTESPHAVRAPGAPPILVVGTTRDPATPYQWARNLAGELSSGVLLTRNGDGHTGYAMGNGCVDSAVDRYLLTGAAPAKGTVCG